jgi:hypothetical protein
MSASRPPRWQTRLGLIRLISSGLIEDRDVEQIVRLHNHLFGVKKDPKLTAAGFYSLTPRQRKKIKRQLDDEFGPQIPDAYARPRPGPALGASP